MLVLFVYGFLNVFMYLIKLCLLYLAYKYFKYYGGMDKTEDSNDKLEKQGTLFYLNEA